jgi:hypothetical protein
VLEDKLSNSVGLSEVESQNFQDRVEATLAFRSGLEDGINDSNFAVGLVVPEFDLSDDEFTEDKFFGFLDRVKSCGLFEVSIVEASRAAFTSGRRLEAATLVLNHLVLHKDKLNTAFGLSAYNPVAPEFPHLKPSSARPAAFKLFGGSHQEKVLDYVVNGLTNGFSIGYEGDIGVSVLHKNPPMHDERASEALKAGIAEDVAKGYTVKISKEQVHSMKPLIVSPVFCIQKKMFGVPIDKYRRIHNLSYKNSKNGTELDFSVNDMIDSEASSMSYVSVADAARATLEVARTGEQPSYIICDLHEAFKQIPVMREEWGLLGFSHDDSVYIDSLHLDSSHLQKFIRLYHHWFLGFLGIFSVSNGLSLILTTT